MVVGTAAPRILFGRDRGNPPYLFFVGVGRKPSVLYYCPSATHQFLIFFGGGEGGFSNTVDQLPFRY